MSFMLRGSTYFYISISITIPGESLRKSKRTFHPDSSTGISHNTPGVSRDNMWQYQCSKTVDLLNIEKINALTYYRTLR